MGLAVLWLPFRCASHTKPSDTVLSPPRLHVQLYEYKYSLSDERQSNKNPQINFNLTVVHH